MVVGLWELLQRFRLYIYLLNQAKLHHGDPKRRVDRKNIQRVPGLGARPPIHNWRERGSPAWVVMEVYSTAAMTPRPLNSLQDQQLQTTTKHAIEDEP